MAKVIAHLWLTSVCTITTEYKSSQPDNHVAPSLRVSVKKFHEEIKENNT